MAPLSARKKDIIYLIFFVIHIPVMLAVDYYPLYPSSMRPAWMTDLRKYYIETYQDQFFVNPPAWFTMFAYMEVLYHLPLTLWAIGALIRDDPRVPIQLLVFACQVTITTMTCISDFLSWTTISAEHKMQLGYLYGPYLALAVFMGVDMIGRLDAMVSRKPSAGSIQAKKRN